MTGRWTPADLQPQDEYPLCPQCQTAYTPGAGHCANCGSFVASNSERRTTGIYALHRLPPEIKEDVDAFRAGVISDLGGESALSTLERALVDKLANIDAIVKLLTHYVAENGLMTNGGKVRDIYPALMTALAAWDRYSQRLGLQRRAKPVKTIAEIFSEYEQ